MPPDVHAVVQDAHDMDIGVDCLEKDDVGTVFVATQSDAQLLGPSSESGIVGKLVEAGSQFVAIASRLFNAESLNRVFRDRIKVRCSTA